MPSLRILSPDQVYEAPGELEQALAGPGFTFDLTFVPPGQAIADDRLALADAVLSCSHSRWPAAVLAKMPRCRAIMRSGVGVDSIDVQAASKVGIAVLNTPDYGTQEVADHTLALLLALWRGVVWHHAALQNDPVVGWRTPLGPLIRRLEGATLGLIGLGRIAQAVAVRAKGFGLKVIGFSPTHNSAAVPGIEKIAHLSDFLARCDVLSLHCPATEATRGLIDAAALTHLKPGALLINTARGAVADLEAIYAALRSGQLGGAALDVLPQEPMAPDHPLIRAFQDKEPWLAGRLTLTPHMAWYSPQAEADLRHLAIERLVDYLTTGNRTFCVNSAELI